MRIKNIIEGHSSGNSASVDLRAGQAGAEPFEATGGAQIVVAVMHSANSDRAGNIQFADDTAFTTNVVSTAFTAGESWMKLKAMGNFVRVNLTAGAAGSVSAYLLD